MDDFKFDFQANNSAPQNDANNVIPQNNVNNPVAQGNINNQIHQNNMNNTMQQNNMMHQQVPQNNGLNQTYYHTNAGMAGVQPVMDSYQMQMSSLERRAKNGRGSMILIAILSLINMILVFVQADLYFTFSMISPTIFYSIGMDYYFALGFHPLTLVFFSIAVMPVVIFFLMYFLSKKQTWPVIVSVVIFSLDTLFLLWILLADLEGIAYYIFDIIFHVWALVSLIGLLRTKLKMQNLQSQRSFITTNTQVNPYNNDPFNNYDNNSI